MIFVDGHVSHRSLQLSEFCAENGIVLVSFIANATHICQPMDVVVYGPLKRKWSENLQRFRSNNTDLERMTKQTFCDLLAKCTDEVCTSDLMKAAFRKTGLYPFDADNFNYEQLVSQADCSDEEPTESEDETFPNNSNRPFLRSLEAVIDASLPGRLQEFKSANDEWHGQQTACDLFEIWKAAGGEASEENV